MQDKRKLVSESVYLETQTVVKENGRVQTTPHACDIESWQDSLGPEKVTLKGSLTKEGLTMTFEPNPPRRPSTSPCEVVRQFNNIRLRQYPRTKQIVISYEGLTWDDILLLIARDAKVAKNLVLEQSMVTNE